MSLANPVVVTHHSIRDAHKRALDEVYPVVFGTRDIRSYDITPRGDPMAYLYELAYRGAYGLTRVTVYEKHRFHDYARYRSVTLTHVDASGNICNQLHNNYAQLMTQGFFNDETCRFHGPLIVISLADVIARVQSGQIPSVLRNRPRSVCTYVEVRIDDLAPYALFVKEY